ncbi:peptidoglycan-binding protein [Streptomyces sp. RS10V-4]|uniref:peptidoglycan-binding domain-containing protein n=1 Tax=Streptomyces rhizoryzae TaxID=2932493 RepID=UPI002006C6AC|nr:peptidoglycan-binding protein [Streptomyces rhizoryzae]MCK7622299.1 peptidoglycan-binding protein [Streptomyces rhizoryzae]
MAPEQHLNWIALPNGLTADGTQAHVAVFLAPRLVTPGESSGTVLERFPDFLAWPDRIKDATFTFLTGRGATPAASPFPGPLTAQAPPPATASWTSLFHPKTPVTPYVFDDPAQQTHRTYSVKDVSTATRTAYATVARESPEAPPPTGGMLHTLRGLAPGTATAAAAGGAEMPGALAELRDFHRLPGSLKFAHGQTTPPAPPDLPEPDFHHMLTLLGDHPPLLRHLGLVLDFLLPADRLPVSSGEQFLAVVPHWTSALGKDSHDVPARTRYVFLPDRAAFVPTARNATADDPLAAPSRGVAALPEEDFRVEQVDLDGAALKLLSLPPDATGLSPVRTHGISLVKNGRLDSLRADFATAADHHHAFTRELARRGARVQDPGPSPADAAAGDAQPGLGPELFAEDVIRGHRMDIWDDAQRGWLSLHRRDVEYRQPQHGPLLLAASDEGFFQDNLIGPPPGSGDPSVAVPETLASWDGWSLSAHRPGLVLDIDEGSVAEDRPPNRPVPVTNDAKTALPLEITATAHPGSLPRLRFGHRYRVRLRTVDLAGNGPRGSDADALMDRPDLALPADGTLVFQRFEAVPAPAVAPRLPFGEGTSAYRLVIRSSPGAGPPPVPAPAPGTPGTPGTGTPAPGTPGSGTPGPAAPVRVLLAHVRFGATNEDVRIVQQALIDHGHPLPGGADGVFGERTRAAYAEEQRDQGFTGDAADGIPGCASLTALGARSSFTVDCRTDPAPGADGAATTGLGDAAGTGRTAEQYAAEFNRTPLVTEGGHAPYQGADERHVVAPKAPLRCVEWHGLLDAAIGSTDQSVQDSVYQLAVRESGSLNDPGQPDVRLEPVPSPAADPRNPANLALHTGEQIELPYLPDPLSTGAVLLDLPGMPPGEPFPVPWDGEVWHRPRSFRLRLVEGTGPPRFDAASRVLTVALPKGAVATVRLCSGISGTAFEEDVLGLASWCRQPPAPPPAAPSGTPADGDGDAAAARAAAEQQAHDALELAAAGRHWMFTPWRELTLVHAVQQPLRAPALDLPRTGPARDPNATAEHLAGGITLDEATTGRIDLVAEWTEVTDDGPAGRRTQQLTVPVFGLLTGQVPRTGVPGAEPAVLRDGRLDFNTEAAEAKARATEEQAREQAKAKPGAGPGTPGGTGHPDGGPAPATVVPVPPVPPKHEFGDTKHRTVRYHPVAGSAFADSFPPEFAAPGLDALTVRGDAQERVVRSSAPPTAPRLLYCVPTLAFEPLGGPPGTLVHRRRGGGIRVYLDRPWYSSGDGELLGVVLGEPPGGDPASLRDAWVTLLGRDPLHRSAPVVAPTAATFTNAERPSGTLSLPTPSGTLDVTVVGFTPRFDADEPGGRWFCDLELDTGTACLPFVRLALVRYQPDAITGAEISHVVLADLVRTLPDRELRVGPGDPLSVSVTGPSWDPTGSQRPRITAALQRRNHLVDDEDLGWVTLDATTTELTSIDAESSATPSYTGQVPVPPVGRGSPLRLLVIETEGIPPDAPPPAPGTPPGTPGPVVYCDAIPLPPLPDGPGDGDGHDNGHDDGHGDGDRDDHDHDHRRDGNGHGEGDDDHGGPGFHGDHGGPGFHGGG